MDCKGDEPERNTKGDDAGPAEVSHEPAADHRAGGTNAYTGCTVRLAWLCGVGGDATA